MRILHTSDWHLGARLYHLDRQPDLRAPLHEIAGCLDDYRVDVILVAGDVLHKRH